MTVSERHKIVKMFERGLSIDDIIVVYGNIFKDEIRSVVNNYIMQSKRADKDLRFFCYGKLEPYYHDEMDYGKQPTYKTEELSYSEKRLFFSREHKQLKKHH